MVKYLIISSFLILISCGKSIEDKDDAAKEELPPDGIYSALLTPVNFRISNQVYGEVKIVKFSDDFNVSVKINSAPRGSFRQHLHTGSVCPRGEMDENGDSYIDAYESKKSSGPIIVPLDGDLSSQERGYNLLLQGNYRYTRSTSYHLMLSDLHQRDEIINDALVKLSEEDLHFERRVVIVYMTNSNLPSSVSGSEIPVACGVLTRISNRTESEEDEWDNNDPPSERPRPRRPRRDPGPAPEPEPSPGPDINPETDTGGGWWARWRSRWERWRNRMNDWWSGGNNETDST